MSTPDHPDRDRPIVFPIVVLLVLAALTIVFSVALWASVPHNPWGVDPSSVKCYGSK